MNPEETTPQGDARFQPDAQEPAQQSALQSDSASASMQNETMKQHMLPVLLGPLRPRLRQKAKVRLEFPQARPLLFLRRIARGADPAGERLCWRWPAPRA